MCRSGLECHTCCKKNTKNKATKKRHRKTAIPRTLRRFLLFCDRYWNLKERNARWLYDSDKDTENDDVSKEVQSSSSSSGDNDITSSASFDLQQKDLLVRAKGSRRTSFGTASITTPSTAKSSSNNNNLLNPSNKRSSFCMDSEIR